jgi:hypothetical protein
MKVWLALALALAGCFEAHDGTAPDASADAYVVGPAASCERDVSIDLDMHHVESLTDVALTTAGSTMCIHLTTTSPYSQSPAFEATTMTAGSQPSSSLAIYSATDELAATAYTYTVGGSIYTTASVSLDTNTTYTVKLVAWSLAPSATATFRLTLYQVLD